MTLPEHYPQVWADMPTLERMRVVKQLVGEGYSHSQIARQLQTTKSTIAGALWRSRNKPPKRERTVKHYARGGVAALPPALEAEFATMWNRGVPSKELSRHFNMSRSAIYNACQRLALTPRATRVPMVKLSVYLPRTLYDRISVVARQDKISVYRWVNNHLQELFK